MKENLNDLINNVNNKINNLEKDKKFLKRDFLKSLFRDLIIIKERIKNKNYE